MTLKNIPRILSPDNIEEATSNYLALVSQIPLSIESDNFLGLMRKLKRDKISSGPYPHVSIFEAANRLMSDLVILFGIRNILNGMYPELSSFKEFVVELGNEKANSHDISSTSDVGVLVGEAFNVAPSFFNGKSSTAVRKLLNNQHNPDYLIILCNADSNVFSSEPLIKGGRVRVIPIDVTL